MSEPAQQSRRGLARRLTVQALYNWLVNETPPNQIMKEFREDQGYGRADAAYFQELLTGTVAAAAAVEVLYMQFLDRPADELDPMEHAILMVGTFELAHKPEVPWKVAVNEAVNLAKLFGGVDESYKFVNGVLDRVAHQVRAEQIAAGL